MGSDAPAQYRRTYVHETGLLLVMHADVVTVDVRWDFFPFAGIERKADALLQFRQERVGSPAMFKEEKFETSLFPALTQNFAGAENFRHAANYLDDLVGLDESVECHREVRIGGKTASDAQGKTYLGFSVTASSGGGEADVVDFGIGAPVAATGDGDFEFAGQIVKLGIATEFAVDLQRERGGVDNLLAIEAGWTVTEVGRQPWTVYGLMRTADSVSPSLTGRNVLVSLIAYGVVYLIIFPVGVALMARLVRLGPLVAGLEPDPVEGGRPDSPVRALPAAPPELLP